MDSSCSSIKADRDRPRDRPHPAPASAAPSSRHDLPKRPSRDRDADRTSDRPAAFSDAGRDFRRKSHAPDRDDLDDSSERGERSSRSFPRKTVSAFERSDRHFSGKPFTAERDRSDRTDGGRRKFLDGDRDGVDKFESTRSFGRRSYGGNGRQETPEGSLNSPSWEERDHGGTSASRAARKGSGFDREWRDGADSLIRKGSSGSEHCAADDADFCRSPSGKDFGASREGPIPSKFSPSRSHTLDRREPLSPRTLSKLSPRDNRVDNLRQKLSPKIASETTRDHQRGEESQRPPLKLKSHFKREDEPTSSIQRKDEGASSDEADTWIWRRNSSSKGHGFSHELVEESSSEARSSHDEGWRERRTDTPITYFHIAKKVRSDRRREERGNKGTHQVGAEDSGTRNLSLEKLRPDVAEEEATVAHAVQKADAGEGASKSTGNPDLAVAQGDEKPLQKTEELHANGLSSNREDESEMEEGELPDEDLKDGKPEKALINLNEEHRDW